jgi:hypothetical protein
VSHFPGSELEIEKIVVPDRRELQTLYKISYSDKVLLTIDNKGVNYLFPNRYRSNWWGWDGIIEGSPEAIAEVVLRDLANSNFATLDRLGRKIIKRPIKLSKTTVCPKCNSLGSIKRYFFGQVGTSTFAKKLAKDRIILGRGRRKNDPEALCTSCDWTGSTEVFRFPGKSI